MAFSRDEIMKAYDTAIGKVARKRADATDEEIDAAMAIVCTKCPGVTPDEIREALRADVEQLRGDVAALDRVLKSLETMVKERDGLPGLPGGPPLKH